jgi:hypothetical protein
MAMEGGRFHDDTNPGREYLVSSTGDVQMRSGEGPWEPVLPESEMERVTITGLRALAEYGPRIHDRAAQEAHFEGTRLRPVGAGRIEYVALERLPGKRVLVSNAIALRPDEELEEGDSRRKWKMFSGLSGSSRSGWPPWGSRTGPRPGWRGSGLAPCTTATE